LVVYTVFVLPTRTAFLWQVGFKGLLVLKHLVTHTRSWVLDRKLHVSIAKA
jgi:hypothetical protein